MRTACVASIRHAPPVRSKAGGCRAARGCFFTLAANDCIIAVAISARKRHRARSIGSRRSPDTTNRQDTRMKLTLNVNGKSRTVDVDPRTPLLWVLRDELELKGTKFGCGMSLCGACTVHLDGAPTRACVTPVSAVAERAITTIEGIGTTPLGSKVQAAWLDVDVVQCGYCQAGQIMSATALLSRNAEALRRRHRQGDGRQPLPLRHLYSDPRRHQAGGRPPDDRHEGGLTRWRANVVSDAAANPASRAARSSGRARWSAAGCCSIPRAEPSRGRRVCGRREAERLYKDDAGRHRHYHGQEPRDRPGREDHAADADRGRIRRRLEERTRSSRRSPTAPSTRRSSPAAASRRR